jgi:hypothetical protein
MEHQVVTRDDVATIDGGANLVPAGAEESEKEEASRTHEDIEKADKESTGESGSVQERAKLEEEED